MKLRNPFLILAFLFMGAAFFNKFFLSKKGDSATQSSTQSSFTNMLDDWSWATTTPGQAITKWLGPGWADWVMWALVVIFIAWVASFFFNKEKAGKTAMVVLVFVGTMIFLISVFSGILSTYHQKTNLEPVEHPVNFYRKPAGHKVLVEMVRPNDKFIVFLDSAIASQTNGKAYTACAKVVRPELPVDLSIKFRSIRGTGTNANTVIIAEESQAELIKQGFGGINLSVEFTLFLKERGTSVCANDN
jgi:hypothetical protein